MRPPSSNNGGGSGTLRPDGPKINLLRRTRLWTRDDFEMESHLAVEREASKPDGDRKLKARYLNARRNGRLAGISVGVLASVERSNPAFPVTLKIVALTLDVPGTDIIQHG